MAATKIPWCDKTWNPIVGCSKISSGCANCYAERMARRQVAMGNDAYEGTVDDDEGAWTGKLNFVPDQLDLPLHWRKPSRIFACSMADIFHENVKFSWLNRIFDVIDKCNNEGLGHTFLILTKRPEKARYFFQGFRNQELPWKNVWLGVTVERQEQLARVNVLTAPPRPPVAKIFVSCEPMLGPISLQPAIRKVDWVICGSESGPGARPMDPDWARSIRDQCVAAGIPFFLKQMTGVRHEARELPELDGQTWGEFPG